MVNNSSEPKAWKQSDRISHMLLKCDSTKPNFPPTELYNEGWLLRLVLDWFSQHPQVKHQLQIPRNCEWYSEGLIPSPFLSRYRGDPLAETWTHADGIIGQIKIGSSAKGDVSVTSKTTDLVCIEAKLFSRLSKGVTNAPYYDEVARYTACIAELLKRGRVIPNQLDRLGLYLLAPLIQIGRGIFIEFLEPDHIRKTVFRRVNAYETEKNDWLKSWFYPTLESMKIGCLSWESIIYFIGRNDSDTANGLEKFYKKCLGFCSPF